MKTPKPSSQKTINLLLTACIIAFISACEKDKPEPLQQNKTLMGEWYTPMKPDGAMQHVYFLADSVFGIRSMKASDGQDLDTLYTGRFKTRGDSLKISITERSISKQGVLISKEPSDRKIFSNVSYKIANQNLILNYTTAAGAPVRITFMKLLPLI